MLATGETLALTLNDAATHSVYEILYVTAINGAVITCSRGNEGTSPTAWSAGDLCFGALTAGELENIIPSTYVQTFNGRSGAVTLSATDVNGALGYTAANAADVVNTFNGRLGAVNLSSSDVTTALGYTPVETVAIASENGVSGTVAVSGATQTATLALGAITPSSISVSGASSAASYAASGNVSGATLIANGINSQVTATDRTAGDGSGGFYVSNGYIELFDAPGNGTFPNCGAFGATTAKLPGSLTVTTINASLSDRRLKRDIKKFEPRPLHRSVPFVSFVLKENGWHGLGSVAQNMRKVAPEHVGEFDWHGKKRLSLNYAGAAYEEAVWAARELDRQAKLIAKLEARLAKLERRK